MGGEVLALLVLFPALGDVPSRIVGASFGVGAHGFCAPWSARPERHSIRGPVDDDHRDTVEGERQ